MQEAFPNYIKHHYFHPFHHVAYFQLEIFDLIRHYYYFDMFDHPTNIDTSHSWTNQLQQQINELSRSDWSIDLCISSWVNPKLVNRRSICLFSIYKIYIQSRLL